MRFLPLCLTLALGCSAPPPPLVPAPPAPPPPAPVPWSRFAEIAAWPAAAEPFANFGHPDAGDQAQARVSPDARAAYAELVRDSVLPEGSIVALFHSDRTGKAGPVYVMEKQGGTWAYRALTAQGVILEGAAGRCEGCHQGAVGDALFGIPRPREAPRP